MSKDLYFKNVRLIPNTECHHKFIDRFKNKVFSSCNKLYYELKFYKKRRVRSLKFLKYLKDFLFKVQTKNQTDKQTEVSQRHENLLCVRKSLYIDLSMNNHLCCLATFYLLRTMGFSQLENNWKSVALGIVDCGVRPLSEIDRIKPSLRPRLKSPAFMLWGVS